jgi:Tol biopolymer transport system component
MGTNQDNRGALSLTAGLCVATTFALGACTPLRPDSGWVMFEQRTASGGSDVYRVQFDGAAAVSVSPGGARDGLPAWNPARRLVAFESDRDGTWEIYRSDEFGSAAMQLTDDARPSVENRAPAWSPDGQDIAFSSSRDGDFELFLMRDTGSNERALTRNACTDSEPAWSPDGSTIAYTSDCNGDFDLWLIDAPSGTNPRRLLARPGFDDVDPAWSPDGQWLAFESQSTALTNDDAEIWKVRRDGTELTPLAREPGKAYRDPAWAPDGASIAFSRLESGGSIYEIWLMETDGGNKTRISTSSRDEQAPVLGVK